MTANFFVGFEVLYCVHSAAKIVTSLTCPVSFLRRKKGDSFLDFFLLHGIMDVKRALPISG